MRAVGPIWGAWGLLGQVEGLWGVWKGIWGGEGLEECRGGGGGWGLWVPYGGV